MFSLHDKMSASGNRPAGFDYLRIGLSVAVIFWHGVAAAYGWGAEAAYWAGPARGLIYAIVPAFFALSGFLVAGSLLRNSIGAFLALRAIRIVPALFVEVVVSALLIGSLVTRLPLHDYVRDPQFRAYFLNTLGNIHYTLPGVFTLNPAPDVVNVQLWTIPYELECYIGVVFLSLLRLHKSPRLFALAILGLCVAATIHGIATGDTSALGSRPPGRFVVCCFMAGVSLFLLRHRVPFDRRLFALSLPVSYLLLQSGSLLYLACFPVAYATIYLGVTNPRRDILGCVAGYSYGIYLYGFPIQQLVSSAWPDHRSWLLNVSASLAITLVLAACSFHFVEEPTLARKALVLRIVDRVRWPRLAGRRAFPAT